MKPSDNPPIRPEERCKSCDKHRALDSGLCFACGRTAQIREQQEALAGLRTARGAKDESGGLRPKWLPK